MRTRFSGGGGGRSFGARFDFSGLGVEAAGAISCGLGVEAAGATPCGLGVSGEAF